MWRRSLHVVLGLAVLAAALALRIADPPLVVETRLKVFDQFQRLKPRVWEPGPVVVVDIDDASLARIGQWPWPRTRLAELTERLRDAGAAAISFDIVFAEPDRTSPSEIVRLWPDTPATAAVRSLAGSPSLPDHDRVFAQAIAGGGVITGFVLTNERTAAEAPLKAGLAVAGPSPVPDLPRFPGAVVTLPVLSGPAAGSSSLNVDPEIDGVIRRVPLLVSDGKRVLPAQPLEALRVALGAPTILVRTVGASGVYGFGGARGVESVRIGGLIVPTDRSGHLWLYDTGSKPARFVPAWKVLDGSIDPKALEGRIAIVGTSAAGLKDQRTSPLERVVPGAELQAQAIEQMAEGTFLARPDWADGAEVVLMVAVGAIVLLGFAIRRHGAAWSAALAGTVVAAAVLLSWVAFARERLLLDPVYPTLAGLLVYLAASIVRHLESERERKRIRSAFAFYMAPAMVERLAENPGLLKLGGEMRELTLLFCDIRGFTSISERLDAHALTHFINRFLTPMTDIILASGGTIDKYMGDCIMAFWNAPLDDAAHAANGCEAARRMVTRLQALNAELRAEAAAAGERPIEVHVGIGINSGLACVGNMGSAQRFDYSALGDNVNLASRLEGQCKTYGVDVIVSENTLALDPASAAVELDLIRVKGKAAPVRIYALKGDAALAGDPAFRRLRALHDTMLARYRAQDWDGAAAALAAARAGADGHSLEGVYDLYQARIAEFRAAPPGPDWDGVYTASSK